MVLLLGLLIALNSDAHCPIDKIFTTPDASGWGPIQLGMTLEQVISIAGEPLELQQSEYDGSVSGAESSLDGQALSFTFLRTHQEVRLAGVSLIRSRNDPDSCWARDALISRIKERFPQAKYRASRHAPDLSEADNEYPMYSLAPSSDIVILLKPTHGTIYIGELKALD